MTEFRHTSDADLLKAVLFNRSRLAASGCWEWTGPRRAGYGLLARNNRTTGAHRVAYEAYHGPIPNGMVVRHTCDNPSCINPDHLLVGTQADNAADRTARGRGHRLKGERVGTAKLTPMQVLEIKTSFDRSLSELATDFGIEKSNAALIRSGKSWRHLNVPPTLLMEAAHGR